LADELPTFLSQFIQYMFDSDMVADIEPFRARPRYVSGPLQTSWLSEVALLSVSYLRVIPPAIGVRDAKVVLASYDSAVVIFPDSGTVIVVPDRYATGTRHAKAVIRSYRFTLQIPKLILVVFAQRTDP
jgi:hypothetical protein